MHKLLRRYYFKILMLSFGGLAASAQGSEQPESPVFEIFAPEKVVASAAGKQISATEWRLTDIKGETIGLHRYRVSSDVARAQVFYLPGTNMNGVLKTSDERNNLWLFLAARGVTVFTLDYRTRFVGADFNGDLSFMRDWTFARFVMDAQNAVLQIKSTSAAVPLYVAGFSRGVSYAYALAGQVDVAGLIALDGSFKDISPKPYDLAAALAKYDKEGIFASSLSRRGYNARHELMRRAYEAPDGPAIDDRYETAADQLAQTLHRAWGSGALANTQENISALSVLAREMDQFDWFFPTIQDVESRVHRSQSNYPGMDLDDHFGRMTIPIVYFGSTGMGTDALLNGISSASHSGSKDVTINVLEKYGHQDVLFAREAATTVYQVILDWIVLHER